MNYIKLLTLSLVPSLVDAQLQKKYYTMENIKLLGENCFEAAESGHSTQDIELEPIQDNKGYGNIVKIGLKAGKMCWFESASDFMIDANDPIQIYYFQYRGYTPAIKVTREACTFIPTNTLEIGAKRQWFRPNGWGGSCKYLVLLGVDEDHFGTEIVTITEKFDTQGKAASAKSLLASVSSLILAIYSISLI